MVRSTTPPVNLSAPELVCYQSYMETLRDITDREFQTVSIPTSEVYLRKIPLPFPLDRHELFSGEKAVRQMGLQYTPFRHIGRFAWSEDAFLKAIEIFQALSPEYRESPNYVTTLNNLAGLYRLAGEYHKAERLFDEVMPLLSPLVNFCP